MAIVTFEEAVSQIKDKLDIVDVISKDVILKKSGGNYWGLCPFHNEKTPSFSVNPAKGIYKCFGCGEGGDALSYLVKTRGISFGELIRELAQEFGIELPNTYNKVDESTRDIKAQMMSACKAAADFYQHQLFASANEAVNYLARRSIDENIIKKYFIGFATKEPSKLYKNLKDKFSDEILEKSGLILKTQKGDYIDRFRNRIIIPIEDENGNVVAFGARAIEAGQNPKYLNSSDSLIYNKSKLLYGLFHAKDSIKQLDSVVIMEGYFDVISAQAHGIENCVAACGTALTQEHIKLISRYSKSRKIYLSFDTDMAGVKATNRGASIIKEAFEGLGNIKMFDENYVETSSDRYSCEIRVITPPEGKDPDEFIRNSGAEEFAKYLEHAPLLIDFQINQALKNKDEAKTPTEKLQLVKNVVPVLKEIKNKIIRTEYIKMVAAAISVDENALNQEVGIVDNDIPTSMVHSTPIVTKTSNILEKAQKNLLSLYLVNITPLSFSEVSKKVEGVKFTNENLIIVKNTIDKSIFSVNNVKALIEKLYIDFAQDEEKKAIITDLICISEAFNNLNKKDFESVIEENISRINQFYLESEKAEIRDKYRNANDNDNEALKIQMLLRDKINSMTGDNE